ncbi:MAG: DNA polymerase III subunit delta, partial [Bacteroidota bacterium]
YFSKIYLYHAAAQQGDQAVMSALGLRSRFFLKEYQQAARKFSRAHAEEVIHLLREFDLKSKGVGYNATGKPEGELLKELAWRILHL